MKHHSHSSTRIKTMTKPKIAPLNKQLDDPIMWLVNFNHHGLQYMVVGETEEQCYFIALQTSRGTVKYTPRPVHRTIVLGYIEQWRNPSWDVPTVWAVYNRLQPNQMIIVRNKRFEIPI